MNKKISKGNSQFFKSFSVSGDKITIHKCVIDEAIKQVKNNMDPFESGDRVAGKLDILTDLVDAINTGMTINRHNK